MSCQYTVGSNSNQVTSFVKNCYVFFKCNIDWISNPYTFVARFLRNYVIVPYVSITNQLFNVKVLTMRCVLSKCGFTKCQSLFQFNLKFDKTRCWFDLFLSNFVKPMPRPIFHAAKIKISDWDMHTFVPSNPNTFKNFNTLRWSRSVVSWVHI